MKLISKERHILLLTPGFAADEKDTVCIPALQALARALSLHHKVSIFAIDYPQQRGEYEWHGIPVYSAGSSNSRTAKLTIEGQLRQWIRKVGRPELAHSFWWSPAAWLGNRLHRREKMPHVCTLMGQDVLPSNIYLKLLSLSRATQVAISPRQAALFEQHTGQKVAHIIPWGLEEDFRRDQLPDHPRDIDILGAGWFSEVKNYARFVEVVAELVKEMPGLKVVLAGKGAERENLQKLIELHSLEQVIEMPGMLPREEVLALMQRTKVFLHPGRYESFGYVFPEALSQGALIVSLAVGAAIAHPRWTVCGTEAELTEGVRQWLRHYPAPEPVWLHGMSDTTAAYVSLYEELLSGTNAK